MRNTKIIASIDKKTGFKGLRVVKALITRKWDAIRHFRQFFFDKAALSDPYTWTFNHDCHEHLVLYQGTERLVMHISSFGQMIGQLYESSL